MMTTKHILITSPGVSHQGVRSSDTNKHYHKSQLTTDSNMFWNPLKFEPLRQQLLPPLPVIGSERSSLCQISESSATSSRSGEVVQLIIVGWLAQNFRQEILPSHYRNDPVKYDLNWVGFLKVYNLTLKKSVFENNFIRQYVQYYSSFSLYP